MKPRIPSSDLEHSVAERVEYGLTLTLVLVVVVAVAQICGFHPTWLY